jgi:hypothetical protein
MVGGTVIGLSRKAAGTLLSVRDRNGDECAVRCEERRTDTGEPVEIAVGDSVWWQCGNVYWNPPGTDYSGRSARWVDGRATYDIPLPKVGYSH